MRNPAGPARGPDIFLCGTPFEPDLRAGRLTPVDLVRLAADLGTTGIEHRTVYWNDKDRELPQAAALAAELGLACVYACFGTLYSHQGASIGEVLGALEDATALGARIVRVFPGPPDIGPAEQAAAERVVEYARALGIRIAVENFVRFPGNTMAAVESAIAGLDPAVVGVNLDVGNYVKNGQDPVECLQSLLPRVIYCHFKDIRDTPDGPQVTYPGNGRLELHSILELLTGARQRVALGFEYAGGEDPQGAVRHGLDYVRSAFVDPHAV